MSDLINITGIKVFAHHGVLEAERRNGQWFLVDVELRLDLRNLEDRLEATVDYGELVQKISHTVSANRHDLIETVAQDVAQVCLSYSQVHSCKVTVHKPKAPIPAQFIDVSVTIERP